MTDKVIANLYGVDILGSLVLDPTKYRGKGRPRKSDYSDVLVVQKKVNALFNQYLDYLHFKI